MSKWLREGHKGGGGGETLGSISKYQLCILRDEEAEAPRGQALAQGIPERLEDVELQDRSVARPA